MKQVTSTLTKKYQATIPSDVRQVLNLKAGDSLAFRIDNNRVSITKLKRVDLSYLASLESTLEEWSSSEDAEAYDGL